MNDKDDIAAFETVNNSIKGALSELVDLIATLHPWFQHQEFAKNNEAFIALLDQLLELKYTVDAAKKLKDKWSYNGHI